MTRPVRVLPEPSHESTAFWTGGANGELLIYRCRSCRHYFHPPLPACFRCRSREVGPEPVSGRGTVVSFTVNHHPWLPDFPPPYVIALVELDEEPGLRLTSNILECAVDEVEIGQAVEVVFEPAEDLWIPLFRPVSR